MRGESGHADVVSGGGSWPRLAGCAEKQPVSETLDIMLNYQDFFKRQVSKIHHSLQAGNLDREGRALANRCWLQIYETCASKDNVMDARTSKMCTCSHPLWI